MSAFTRRRFLAITAAAAALPTVAAATVARWKGRALGGPVSMQLAGIGDADAAPIFAAVEAELERLERIFSLYRTTSELTRLNAGGALAHPSPELLQVLSLCDSLHAASDGAFDPSIQPLWFAMANGAEPDELSDLQSVVGWSKVSFDAAQVRLPTGGALTLNGIAQGAITDRIAALLRAHGLRDVLVDMGEIAAMGQGPDGPWNIGVAKPDGTLVHRLTATDRALATSVPMAMTVGGSGHILSPTGQRMAQSLVTVSAPTAAVADGLSTALCMMDAERAQAVASRFDGARIEVLEAAV